MTKPSLIMFENTPYSAEAVKAALLDLDGLGDEEDYFWKTSKERK